ncbi:hypothetical protein CWI39_1535p0010 [Hamiltosporidium magnivora]|uniref:Uncharacterized protein n=1 Tax=Hamiltosporidium magnivora TaxID=148818 RepID=A0A4Q9L1I0_9MICR|nr:hypothetical protein CWI39_1535p0010 [Hamiltosporidium magnivora]
MGLSIKPLFEDLKKTEPMTFTFSSIENKLMDKHIHPMYFLLFLNSKLEVNDMQEPAFEIFNSISPISKFFLYEVISDGISAFFSLFSTKILRILKESQKKLRKG